MNPREEAAAVLAEIEGRGGRATLRDGRLVVVPASIGTTELVARVRGAVRDLVTLLHERELSSPPSVACELLRFPDWRPVQVVRFCCEPEHRHEEGTMTYDAQEVEDLLRWSRTAGVNRLPAALRNALLDLKSMIGGRVVSETAAPSETRGPT